MPLLENLMEQNTHIPLRNIIRIGGLLGAVLQFHLGF